MGVSEEWCRPCLHPPLPPPADVRRLAAGGGGESRFALPSCKHSPGSGLERERASREGPAASGEGWDTASPSAYFRGRKLSSSCSISMTW